VARRPARRLQSSTRPRGELDTLTARLTALRRTILGSRPATWHGGHYLDFGYLRNPPRLRLWHTVRGDPDEITVEWRHDDDGEIGFTAGPAVHVAIPTADYRQAVHAQDQELMTPMRQRVEELDRRGGLPGVEVDLAALRRDHEDRTVAAASLLHSRRGASRTPS